MPKELVELDGEIWKEVVGYGGRYKVSNFGRVISNWGGWKEKIPTKSPAGYFYVTIYFKKEGKHKRIAVHRLVAHAFLTPVDGKNCVNHKDGNKQNNAVENLEWCTVQENTIHATRVLGTNKAPEGYKKGRKVPEAEIKKRKEYYKAHQANCAKFIRCKTTGQIFDSIRKAQEFYGLSKRGVYLALRDKRPIKGLMFEIIGDQHGRNV